MKKQLLLGVALSALIAISARAQVSLTGAGSYGQIFDSMGAAGTTTPPGWFVGTGDNTAGAVGGTTVVAGTGSSNIGNNYNYGVAGVNAVGERALGSVASSSTGQRDTEVHFTNNTGFAITQFSISYDGEQWRSGGTMQVANTLTLQFSATGLAGSWVNMGSAFDFTSPQVGAATGPLDGNAAANRVAGIGGTFTPGALIADGQSFSLRWADPDNIQADAGLAIDNFTFSATLVPEPAIYMLLGMGLLVCGQRFLRSKRS